ncbi:cell envelope biogenesis protein OmpA [Acinetobacter guerrae]|uniref:Cell envelope biogenesis protein OmpA n=1 Tax=Acinetobacter guerrae TaxID=1843371 RepID=A0A3A8ENY5_9GAMM|nr:OmpA family protein [Acinetobacter guerrae]RKG36335.1 cell envelope biogenesis protein OmpA [Acinetobacter guerrae]
MWKISLLFVVTSLMVTSCASNSYSKPSALRFQKNTQDYNQLIYVKRDGKLCAGDTKDDQNCPIHFYLDNIESGKFYVNNSAKYYLRPEVYNFKVKNCTGEKNCESCDVDLQLNHLKDRNFLVSVDDAGKPFILNNGQPLACRVESTSIKPVVTPIERTETINLSADTLFKFDGSSLNDLLPKGRQEVHDVALKISTGFVSVSQINLVGHTDRLGNENYNQKLGQSRAETVRNLLIQNGVSEKIISASSAGKNQPVTDGCPTVKSREALKACLQPDRRVTVQITGIAK